MKIACTPRLLGWRFARGTTRSAGVSLDQRAANTRLVAVMHGQLPLGHLPNMSLFPITSAIQARRTGPALMEAIKSS
jgi:hypothetical protein